MDVLKDGKSDISVIDRMGTDESVVRAARVSYGKDVIDTGSDMVNLVVEHTLRKQLAEKDAKLIRFMAEHGHGSPFEHTAITFHVACPLYTAVQWLRHRIGWSYNMVSRRYTEENIEFYIPNVWHRQSEDNRQASGEPLNNPYIRTEYLNALAVCIESYNRMLKAGVSREEARMVLPQGVYTRFYATANLRSIAHFIKLRDHEDAQKNGIVQYARGMYELTRMYYPISIGALV